MRRFGVAPDLSKQLNGLSNRVLDEALLHVGDFHGSRDENNQPLEIVDEHPCLFLFVMVEIFVDLRPIVAVDVQEV